MHALGTIVWTLFLLAMAAAGLALLASVPFVARRKGGFTFGWALFALWMFPIAIIAVYVKRPRGFARYLSRWPNELDYIQHDTGMKQPKLPRL